MIYLCPACFPFVVVLPATPTPRLPKRRCAYCGCELLAPDDHA